MAQAEVRYVEVMTKVEDGVVLSLSQKEAEVLAALLYKTVMNVEGSHLYYALSNAGIANNRAEVKFFQNLNGVEVKHESE